MRFGKRAAKYAGAGLAIASLFFVAKQGHSQIRVRGGGLPPIPQPPPFNPFAGTGAPTTPANNGGLQYPGATFGPAFSTPTIFSSISTGSGSNSGNSGGGGSFGGGGGGSFGGGGASGSW